MSLDLMSSRSDSSLFDKRVDGLNREIGNSDRLDFASFEEFYQSFPRVN